MLFDLTFRLIVSIIQHYGSNPMFKNMFKKLLTIIPIALFFGAVQVQAFNAVVPSASFAKETQVEMKLIGQQEMSLLNRYGINPEGADNIAYRDNILLNLAYMSGKVHNAGEINWDAVRAPSSYAVTLQPGEVFAFHEDVLPEYEGKVVASTNAHFGAQEGFKSSGGLSGMGVCHFASIINWAARDAGLKVTAPTNHNFAIIPDIDPMYGTAIYYMTGTPSINMQQNLYVENTFDSPVKLVISYENNSLKVSVYK